MELFKSVLENKKIEGTHFTGLTDDAFAKLLHEMKEFKDRGILVVTTSLFEANKLYELVSDYTDKVLLFPMDDFLTSEAVAISPDLMITRLETLNQILGDSKSIVITNLMGYLRFLPTKEVYKNSFISLRVVEDIDPTKLVENLVDIGYTRETIVTRTGEFAVRGFVVDIFPLGSEYPIRIEFFGDTIDSIRTFDPDTQKSISTLKSIEVKPFSEFIVEDSSVSLEVRKQKYLPEYSKNVSSLYQYMDNAYLCFKDYRQMKISYQNVLEEVLEYRTEKDKKFVGEYFLPLEEVEDAFHYLTVDNYTGYSPVTFHSFDIKSVPIFRENIEAIQKYLKENLKLGKTILIFLKDYQIKNFKKHFFSFLNELKILF